MSYNETREVPFGPIGEVVFYRTYARRIDDDVPDVKETFEQTIDRVLDGCEKQLKIPYTAKEREEVRNTLLSLKGMVAGRFLWQLGTSTVDRLGFMSLMNCAACVVDEPVRPFTWTFDALMVGSGVGYNLQLKHVYSLPRVKKIPFIKHLPIKDADFIVPDSREGWVELLRRVLEAYFITGEGFTYSTILVRGAGEVIKGFGGTASGPGILIDGIGRIQKVLQTRVGQKVSPLNVLDIMNIIGSVVVAGNVRRSAQLAIGDLIDTNYLNSKNWGEGNIPNHRSMSNNSVVVKRIQDIPESFWEGYKGNGEPFGLINIPLSKKCGRLGDFQYTDPDVEIYNPCAEQSLENYEVCALGECYLPNHTSKEELSNTVKILYRIIKHSLRLPCHMPETEAVVHKNMRMGIGMTGYMQATEDQKSWLPEVYEQLRAYDKLYSAKMGWPESIKLSTCKPSGTLSLLAGVTPGVHPGFSHYHIRRVRMRTDDPIVLKCKKAGYHVEYQEGFDGKPQYETSIVSFPCSFPLSTVVASQITAIDQLEAVKRLQTDWSDNSVSCTVYYKLEELPTIRKWLEENYEHSVKTISFLLHSGHGFKQAPLEEITEEQYNEMTARIVEPLDFSSVGDDDGNNLFECEAGICPVK
jgi:adenosylcobalamin-dependent ribonucleoside-triphosphate reductase